jgi:hypothetical protein
MCVENAGLRRTDGDPNRGAGRFRFPDMASASTQNHAGPLSEAPNPAGNPELPSSGERYSPDFMTRKFVRHLKHLTPANGCGTRAPWDV